MKRFLVPIALLVLAACSQAPTPGDEALPNLSPMTFGSSRYDFATSLGRHGSGVYVAGYTDGRLHGTHKGGHDAFVRKVGTSGAVLWGRQFGTPGSDYLWGVASDGSNNAYLVGHTTSNLAGSRGYEDGFVRKYTSSGSVSWTKQFGTPGYDYAYDVATFGTNAVYVVGYTTGNLGGTGNLGATDAYIVKYTAAGGVAWTRQFGTSSTDLAHDVAVDGSGNAYVVGFTGGSLPGTTDPNGAGDHDMFIRRYNANGTVQWTRQLHYSNDDTGQAVAVSGTSVYLVGSFEYQSESWSDVDVRIVKYTTGGLRLWDTRFGAGSNEHVEDVSANSSGVLFSGWTDGSIGGWNQGGYDGFVVKFDGLGNFVWAAQQGTFTNESTSAVLARSNSEVYAAGHTYGVLGSSNKGNADAFLRRLNGTTGATVWTDQ